MTLIGRMVLAVVTGASRGIGREIVSQLSKIVAKGSVFLITARTATQLEELKQEVKISTEGIDIHVLVCDAETLDSRKILEFEAALSALIENSKTYDVLLIVHNAGTVGNVTKRGTELSSSEEWLSYLQTNFISMVLINNLVLRVVNQQIAPARYVINVTSLLAIKAFPSMAQYSVGKAAREAFFRSLAVEEPNLRILNYSPGPVRTNMYAEIAENSYDENIRKLFQKQGDGSEINRRTLLPEETVKKMLLILEEDTFENGSRIDFFDL